LLHQDLRGVTQEFTTDSLPPPPLVDSKQADACRPGSRRVIDIDVQGDVTHRGTVPVGDDNVSRVPLDAPFNPRRVELIAARGVEMAVGVKPRIAMRCQRDRTKAWDVIDGGRPELA
jgi:hypothetical protein